MGKASRLKRERKLAQAADQARAERVQLPAAGNESRLIEAPPDIEKTSASPEMAEARRRDREEALLQAADNASAERHRRSELGGRSLLVKDVPGIEKMSAILGEFAQPLLEMCRSHEDRTKSLQLALIAWNTALLPEEERAGSLDDTKITEVLGPEGMRIMDYLIQRKLDLFPDKKRPVLDTEVVDLDERFFLKVISGLPMDDPKTVNALKAQGLLPEEGPGSGQ